MNGPDDAREIDVRRRRAVAVGALAVAFLLLIIAVVLATTGGGGGGGGGHAKRASQTTHRAPAKQRAAAPAPAPAATGQKNPTAAVPVLMYHLINSPKPGTAQPELWVPRADFQAQMKYLADNGYHSQYTNALPILKAQGWPGVLNLEVNQTQQDLTPDEVKALMAAGWEVDAHTISHPDLTTVDDTQLQQEVAGSRKQLQQMFGVPVNFFCYPAGRFDDRVVAAVKAAGYLGATTTQLGLAKPSENPYQLPRVRINGSDGLSGFQQTLSGAEGGASGGNQGGE